MDKNSSFVTTGSYKNASDYTSGPFSPNDEECLHFPNHLAIISQVASFTIGILALYTTVALSLHLFLRHKHKTPNIGRKSRRSTSINADHQKRGKLYKRTMNLNMINAAFCITVRCALDIAILRSGHIKNPGYAIISRIEILLNIATLSSMYLVLWLRQWSFYTHPCMGEVKYQRLRVVCVILLVVMIASGVWNAIAFLLERNVYFDENNCIVTSSSGEAAMIKFYVLGGCTLFYQAVLLGLFAYPLSLHSKKNVTTESSKRKSLFRVLKRVFIAAIICCVTDTLASVASVLLEAKYPESSFIVYNFNLMGNFLSLMYTFSDCKIRLLYPFIMCKRTVPVTWSASTTANSLDTSNM